MSNPNNIIFIKILSQCKRICKINGNPVKSKIYLTKIDDITIVVISEMDIEANMRNWVIDSGATRHISVNKNDFMSYTQIEKG